MSALDQAIIKAYAKDRPAATPVRVAASPPRQIAPAARSASARAVEQAYHAGALYHAESPAAAPRANRAIPAPHLAALPPTSPRRNVRRSMLRMLAAGSAAPAIEAAPEPTPRVARKVIIRHISHPAAPPPLGLIRPARIAANDIEIETPQAASPAAITLPSALEHSADHAHARSEKAPPAEIPEIQPIEVRGDWDHETALSPMVLVAEVPPSAAPSLLVHVQVDSLESIQSAMESGSLANAATTDSPAVFAAKSLDDSEDSEVEARLDSPHAFGRHRPHLKFPRPEELPPVMEEVVADEEIVAEAVPDQAEELTFADPASEALASDLIPSNVDAADELQQGPSGIEASANPAPIKAAIAQWEVDRFHWPRTCEKLFADEHGYLARAGDKLQAAQQDGLKVLAITGSRRGEGRSTLALCLARAAAQVGIQAAVMDADFARPQLASKVGVEITHGWQDAALGRVPLSEAAVKSLTDNVTLLPLDSSLETRSLSLADPRVTATIRAAAATFELLIIDLGPQSGGEIAFPPDERCPFDAAIVVRDLRFATTTESEAIGHMLQDAGIEAVGIAENFVIEDEIPATSV